MLLCLSMVLALIVIAFSLPFWLWRVGVFWKLERKIEAVEELPVQVSYSGIYDEFHLYIPNRHIIGYYECRSLRNKVRSNLNQLSWTMGFLVVVQVLVIGAYFMFTVEGGSQNARIHPIFLIPWSEAVAVVFFVVFVRDVHADWERLEDDLPRHIGVE